MGNFRNLAYLALRKSCRFQGYFWIAKVLYEKEGIKPVKTIRRNDAIYAYNPSEEMLQKILQL